MQKSKRFNKFIEPHLSNAKARARQKGVSDKLFNRSLAAIGLFFIIGLAGLGIFLKNTTVAAPETVAVQTPPNDAAQNIQRAEYKAIDYDKPESDIDITYDAAGQGSARQLTPAEIEAQQKEMEGGIQKVVKTSQAAFLPTMWAHVGRITNEFGQRRNPFGGLSYEFHAGMDISGDTGDVVVAPANGVVSKAGWLGGYGNMVELNHGNGLTTRYGHLSKLGVRAGDKLQRGQILGLVGSTGRSTGAHLHFEVRLNDRPINPRRFLPPLTTDVARLQPRN